MRGIPARLAGPVWVDDENFDLTFHVRRSALPRPGTLVQLQEFVGRVLARRLDRSRPLWEIYLVEGLEDDRFALLAKSHLCLGRRNRHGGDRSGAARLDRSLARHPKRWSR